MRKRPRRIAFVATSTGIGGMERLMAGLARQMAQRGIDVDAWLAQTAAGEATVRWLNAQGARAQQDAGVMNSQRAQGRREMLDFARLMRRARADVVNLHCGTAHISLKETLAARMAGKPCVATIHAVTPWSECGAGARESTRRAARLCRAVIVHSSATRANLLDAGVDAAKIHLVPCGIPLPPTHTTRHEARQTLNLPQDAFVIVTASRLIAAKGIDDLLHAVSQMREMSPNNAASANGVARPTCLLIAGDGPECPALRSLADCLPGVDARFLGYCEDLNAVYASGDVFALPSHAESFGLVFLEAALRGLPAVGTRVGGIPEAVLDNETGLLVPARDQAALAHALCRLRDDTSLRQKLGNAAQSRVRTQFSEEAMAAQYLQALGV